MTRLRITADVYERPDDFENPTRDATSTVRAGELIDAGDAETEALLAQGAAVESSGDESDGPASAAKAHLEMLEGQLERMREEHETMVSAGTHHSRVIDLSSARVSRQEADVARAKQRAGVKPQRGRTARATTPAPADPPAAPAPTA